MHRSNITMKINGRIIEAECPICRDVIYRSTHDTKVEDEEKALHEATNRHYRLRHSGQRNGRLTSD
jgi:hypothetical protein